MRPSRRGPLIVLICLLVIAACLIAVGIYGLVRGPAQSDVAPSPRISVQTGGSPSSSRSPLPAAQAASLPKTDDPVAYARGVAEAIFTWDTMSGLTPADYTNTIVAGADPSGLETPGLVADLATYLPTDEVWQELRSYQTRETLTIRAANVPAGWPEVLSQAGSQLRDGTTAVTITGTRHRTGTWGGQSQAAATDVSFTVFMVCRPAYPVCHVLRLSQLGNPLK
jgi:hypothetical protein